MLLIYSKKYGDTYSKAYSSYLIVVLVGHHC